MATKSKSRKRKSTVKAETELQPKVKASTRIAAFVAVIAVFALLGGMIAMGSAGTF